MMAIPFQLEGRNNPDPAKKSIDLDVSAKVVAERCSKECCARSQSAYLRSVFD